MLEELSKKDKYWRQIALNICKSKSVADDIVQEMYLKLHDCKKQINDFYVILTIRSLFLDTKRKKQNVELVEYNLQSRESDFKPDDYETYILNEYKKLSWIEREIIIELYDKSFRELADSLTGVSYNYIFRKHKTAIQKILKEDIDLYKNTRLKHLKNG